MSSYELTMLSRTIDTRSQTDRRLHFLTDGILLPLITLGIWGIVWAYRYLSDPNRHFENQWTWEDRLTASLSS